MAGRDVGDAASRIRGILNSEDLRRRRVAGMMDHLRVHGWVKPRPAPQVQGPSVASAANAIETRLAANDALRAEAAKQVAPAAPLNRSGEPGFLRAAPESGVAEKNMPSPDDAALGGGIESLRFKRDPDLDPWRPAAYAMAKYIGVDPELAVAAGPRVIPALVGARAYRHLDRMARLDVMKLVQALQLEHPLLYGDIQGEIIAAQESPFQSIWAMSDDDIREHVQRQRNLLDIIDVAGDAQDAGELGVVAAGATNLAGKLTIPAAVASGVLLATKYATKADIAHMEAELEKRRNGGNPFEQEQP